ncbi:hypothetical protein [Pseudomonas sp. 17033095]|uniref:hypothetical protein n=1 Tax=Pseudomonas sp. 17033095 TaxID=2952231 RepID=UPI00215830DA|nr:hypothetical protein [Pseudomonas sp. 17033095]HEJ5892305.1 hypothetical protein [Pseudomonas aeruginosa]
MSIDWSKAPEGTTHYHIAEDINPWRKIEGTVAYEHYRGKWLRVNSFNEGYMPDYYVPIPRETWDGQGLPPVGLMAEWKAGLDHDWQRVTVLAYANGDAWLQPEDGGSFIVGNPANFRRIRTPEQIAAEEREKAVGDMAMSIQGVPYQYPTLYALFDAGYRRQESST